MKSHAFFWSFGCQELVDVQFRVLDRLTFLCSISWRSLICCHVHLIESTSAEHVVEDGLVFNRAFEDAGRVRVGGLAGN